MKNFIIIVLLLILIAPALGAHERDYQEHANKTRFHGITEHVLDDGTRVDILVKGQYVIEVDFAKKWYEAIGQASHYSYKTKIPPAIYLIVRTDEDLEKVERAKRVCERLFIVIDNKLYRYTVFFIDDRDGKESSHFGNQDE